MFSGGVADVGSRFSDVFCHNCTCTDHHIVTYGDGENRRIAANGNPVADKGRLPQRGVTSSWPPCSKGVVDEHDAVSDEAIAADAHEFADEAVTLNLGSFPDGDALLDFAKWAYKCAVAKGAFVEIARLNDGYTGSECDIPNRGPVHFGLRHVAHSGKWPQWP